MSIQNWEKEVADFQIRLDSYISDTSREDIEDDNKSGFEGILAEACTFVRQAEAINHPHIKEIVEEIHNLLDSALTFAYGSSELYDFMPSFAHSDDSPLLQDPLKMSLGQGVLDSFLQFFTRVYGTLPAKPLPTTGAWRKEYQPHPKTTPLSRFRRFRAVSATDATPTAQAIYQARREITTDDICSPGSMDISSGGSCLAIVAAGGWKNRDPILHYSILDDQEDDEHSQLTISPGLEDVAFALALYEPRKLMFVADRHRIKSFTWAPNDRGKRGAAVHTLSTGRYAGPLAILSNGTILRGGSGSAAMWKIDELETHGPRNKKIGKGKVYTGDSWRDQDNGDEIETSTGSKPHSIAPFVDKDFTIGAWRVHQPTVNLLCSHEGQNSGHYGCVSLDLEDGGKVVQRYLGHGGGVNDFSTSEGDPNTFVTSCTDGFVRLSDVRHVLPVMTLDVERQGASVHAGLWVHPDGIPTIFTGGVRTEQIKLWDVRAKKVVYELSTGNTAVQAMAWDTSRSTLYAATECMQMDRMGSTHDYRHAKSPKFNKPRDNESEDGDDPIPEVPNVEPEPEPKTRGKDTKAENDDEEDEDGEDEDYEDDDDDDDDDEFVWPKNAFHGEDFYGKMFDAATHSLMRYAFRQDPEDLYPASGYATIDGDDYF